MQLHNRAEVSGIRIPSFKGCNPLTDYILPWYKYVDGFEITCQHGRHINVGNDAVACNVIGQLSSATKQLRNGVPVFTGSYDGYRDNQSAVDSILILRFKGGNP